METVETVEKLENYEEGTYYEKDNFKIVGELIKDNEVTIKYYGKLLDIVPNEDVEEKKVFLYYGFGSLWNNKTHTEMEYHKSEDSEYYCATLKLVDVEDLVFCFMDSFNNWDLNGSSSYSVELSDKQLDLSKTETELAEYEEYPLNFFDRIFKNISNSFILFLDKLGKIFYKKV